MKSKKVDKEKKKEKPPYPYLGEDSDGWVILFTKKNTGFAVYNQQSSSRIGHYSEVWDEERARVFTGTIELSNE